MKQLKSSFTKGAAIFAVALVLCAAAALMAAPNLAQASTLEPAICSQIRDDATLTPAQRDAALNALDCVASVAAPVAPAAPAVKVPVAAPAKVASVSSSAVASSNWPAGVQIVGAPEKAYPANYWSDGRHPDQFRDARNTGTPFGILLADPGERNANCALPDPDGVIAQVKKDRGEPITCVTPDTQGKLIMAEHPVEIPANGYSLITAGYFRAKINGFTVIAPPKEGYTYHLYVRGLPGDKLRDTAEGRTMLVSSHNAAHGNWNTYDAQGAFLSYVQSLEEIQNSHTRKNCGDAGCSNVVIIELDSVSGAYTVARHTVSGGFTDIQKNW